MAEIKNVQGRVMVDYMARDYDSLLQAMREQIPSVLPEWTDYTSDADFGNALLQLFAHMGDILSYYQDRIANESFLGTAQSRQSIIQHLRLIGYRLGTAAPASAMLTVLFPENCEKTVIISKGDAFATKSQKDQPSVRFEYAGQTALQIDVKHLPTTTDKSDKPDKSEIKYRYYGPDPWPQTDPTSSKAAPIVGIPVQEGRLVRDEYLGGSNGLPNQRFPLAHSRLILRPTGQDAQVNNDLILLVSYGNTIERWHFRETLAFSRPIPLRGTYELEPQKHFTIDIDENDRAVILFGDGDFGAIPKRGAEIKATYRVGGGSQGNVAAGYITTIANAPQLAGIGAKVVNVASSTGGAERETIRHAVSQAPSVFNARKRAVTQQDFEALARSFDGVGKVRASPDNWNLVTLHVAPAGGGNITDQLKQNLLAYFEDKRPITTRIEVSGVDYVKIFVTAEIKIEPYYDPQEVKARVLAAAGQLLAFDNVDFGQGIYVSRFYDVIQEVEGVTYVTITEFRREPVRRDENPGIIQLSESEIPAPPDLSTYPDYKGGIKVKVVEDQSTLS